MVLVARGRTLGHASDIVYLLKGYGILAWWERSDKGRYNVHVPGSNLDNDYFRARELIILRDRRVSSGTWYR